MFASSLVAASLMSAAEDEKHFQNYIAAMPEDQRAGAIQRRKDWRQELQRQFEHNEMVEAAKPHTLWSFLGLGRK